MPMRRRNPRRLAMSPEEYQLSRKIDEAEMMVNVLSDGLAEQLPMTRSVRSFELLQSFINRHFANAIVALEDARREYEEFVNGTGKDKDE